MNKPDCVRQPYRCLSLPSRPAARQRGIILPLNRTGLVVGVAVSLLIACAVSCVEEPYAPPNTDNVEASILARVVDTEGNPVHGASVYIDGRTYRSDADGVFSVRGLRKGPYALSVARNEYTDSTFDVELLEGQQWRDSCPMRPFYVTVTGVVHGGGPGVGVSVVGQGIDTLTDALGSFTIRRVVPGDSVVVLAADPLKGWGRQAFYNVAPGCSLRASVGLGEQGGSVRGTIHGEDSAGATVTMLAGSFSATTDAVGKYELRNVPTGVSLQLSCEAITTKSHTAGIVVPSGGQVTVDLALLSEVVVPTPSGTFALPPLSITTQGDDSVELRLPSFSTLQPSDTLPQIALYLLCSADTADTTYSSSPRFRVPAPSMAGQSATYLFGFLPVVGEAIGWGEITVTRTVPPVSYIRLDRVHVPFDITVGEGPMSTDTVRLWSSGATPLTVRTRTATSWLSVPTGTISSADSTDTAAIPIAAMHDTMSPGVYSGLVECVNDADSSDRRSIEVTLTVTDTTPPRLAVNRTTLSIAANAGTDAAADNSVKLWNAGGGELRYSTSVTSSDTAFHITVGPASGSSSGPSDTVTLQLTFGSASLPIGSYTATVTISNTTSPNDSHDVEITLTVGGPSIGANFPSGLLRNDTLYTFRDKSDGRMHPDTLHIWNSGTGVLHFGVTHTGE
ncbi:MAG: hypothetical protein GF331_05835, partial [Chitinivibrionales bacterium]|nr:hypothetical protein [Chitinivibrionales bacterium]